MRTSTAFSAKCGTRMRAVSVTYSTHIHTRVLRTQRAAEHAFGNFSHPQRFSYTTDGRYMLAACATKAFLNDYFFDFSLISRSIHRATNNRHCRATCHFILRNSYHSALLEIVFTCARLEFLRSIDLDILKFRDLRIFTILEELINEIHRS